MKNIPKPGEVRAYRKIVLETDQAIFHGEILHAVCSTFALARDMEWASRLFFIEMKDDDEEGVGTFLNINHASPAFVGEELLISAMVDQHNGNELICSIEVKVGNRLIATGKTGQKMLKKEKLIRLFTRP